MLDSLCSRPIAQVSSEDKAALLALAENDAERRLPLRLLAVIVLDREKSCDKVSSGPIRRRKSNKMTVAQISRCTAEIEYTRITRSDC